MGFFLARGGEEGRFETCPYDLRQQVSNLPLRYVYEVMGFKPAPTNIEWKCVC